MSMHDRIRPSDFHISNCRLTYDIVVIWELPIYTFVSRMTLLSFPKYWFYESPTTERRLKMRLRKIQDLLFARGRGTRKGDRGNAGTIFAITALGRPRTNHFARPTIFSRNLELCISSKTNRIFACDHANFLYTFIVSARHFFERRYSMLYKFRINFPL